MNYNAEEIASIIDGKIIGNPRVRVQSVAKIEDGKKGDLCFLANEKYKNYIYTTKASVIIVNNSLRLDEEIKSTLIVVNDSYSSFSKLLEIYNNNQTNFNIEFTFEGTGICKIKKLSENKLNMPKDIKSRKFSIKNLIRKVIR